MRDRALVLKGEPVQQGSKGCHMCNDEQEKKRRPPESFCVGMMRPWTQSVSCLYYDRVQALAQAFARPHPREKVELDCNRSLGPSKPRLIRSSSSPWRETTLLQSFVNGRGGHPKVFGSRERKTHSAFDLDGKIPCTRTGADKRRRGSRSGY